MNRAGASPDGAAVPAAQNADVCGTHLTGTTRFADSAWHGAAEVIENVRLARDTYRLRFQCAAIARRIVPGQFVMLRLAAANDPLLGRPLALYDTVLSASGEPLGIDVVYLVVGKLTRRLAELQPGGKLEVWGPLGNGFSPVETTHLVMVAGGIGQTPFPALAREYLGQRGYGDPARAWSGAEAAPLHSVDDSPRESKSISRIERPDWHADSRSESSTLGRRVTFCYGARSAEYLAGLEDFRRLGVEMHMSTDDGTAGHHGLVTDVLRQVLDQAPAHRKPASLHVACCGPEPMMAGVAGIARDYGVSCQASLETPMACGIGICFSCVAKVRQADGSWDYRRTCVEGPVFDAQQIVW